jgi:phage tail tape measure protein, TP901 family
VAAIGAVIAALVLLYTNNEDFRNFVNEAWKNIQEVIGNVITAIVGFWNNTLQPAFKAIGDFAINTLLPILKTAFSTIGNVVQSVFNLVKSIWEGILKPVFTAIGAFLTGVLQPVFHTAFEAIKGIVSAVFSAIGGLWSGVLKPVLDGISAGINAMANFVKNPLESIKSTFSSVFSGIKSFVAPIVDWLKGIFNFNWSLPHINLPHFSLVGEFSLLPPKVPHLSVDWYDRATKNPRILDGATIFGARGNTLLGGGETAREVIMSENYLRNLMSSKGNNRGTVNMGGVTININGYNGDAKRLAEIVEEQLTNMERRREMAFNG